MRTTTVTSVVIAAIVILISSTTFALDYAQLNLPEGAKLRIGEGALTGNIAFSPDSTRLAIATALGVLLVDANTGSEIDLLAEGTDNVNFVAFSHDGNVLASLLTTSRGSGSHTIHLWNARTGQHLQTTQDHGDAENLAFNSDGRLLIGTFGGVNILSTDSSGMLSWESRLGSGGLTTVSPDGRLFATRLGDTTQIQSVEPGEVSTTIFGPELGELLFSPDGNRIATIGRDVWSNSFVNLLDARSGEHLLNLEHEGVRAIAFSSDGRTLASLDSYSTKFWDAHTGEHKQTIPHNESFSLALSSDGLTLATANSDGSQIELYNVSTGERVHSLERSVPEIWSLAFSPDGNVLAGVDGWSIRLWDSHTGDHLRDLPDHVDYRSLAFSPDEQTLAGGIWMGPGQGDLIHLWNYVSGQLKMSIQSNNQRIVDSLVFSPNGLTLASGGYDYGTETNFVRLHEVSTGKTTATISNLGRFGGRGLTFSPDGLTLAAGDNHVIVFWDARTGQRLRTIDTDINRVFDLAFSPDGLTLASGGRDGGSLLTNIQLWDVGTSRLLRSIEASEVVYTLTFLPDGFTLASGHEGGKITLWDTRTGSQINELKGHTSAVARLALSPDGLTLASSNRSERDGTILLWDSGYTPPQKPDLEDSILHVSTSSPLTEKILDGSEVTLTLEDGTFEQSLSTIRTAVIISGIAGVSVGTVKRVSDTKVVIVLAFDGTDFDTDATLAFIVDAGAIADYSDSSFTANLSVTAIVELQPLAIYWVDRGTNSIRGASLDGSRNEGIVTRGLKTLSGLALDVAGGQIYWTQLRAKKIQRADLDGSNLEDLVTQGLELPRDIAVTGSKMYWTDSGTDKIQRADLDGSNVEDLVTRGLRFPHGLALDTVAGKMYWTDSGTDKIQRADLDGSNVEDLVTQGLGFPIDITLDVTGGKMYWTDVVTNKIQRANLDGSNVEDLVTGLSGPHSIALDVASGTMYWTDWRADKIQRANLNGSNVEDVVTHGVDNPSAIAIDSSSVQPPVETTDPVDEKDDEETVYQAEDVNRDGTVDAQDIVYIAGRLGQTGQSNADVNGDEIVDVLDVLLVAAVLLNDMPAAPAAIAKLPKGITAATIQQWLTEAELAGVSSPEYLRGMVVLEQWLASLAPRETALLANYPNPFNPETWIPYQLAIACDTQISIYDINGVLVRQLNLGYQRAGYYTDRSRAAYWDGCNNIGERVATGVYFYQLQLQAAQTDYVPALRKMVILK